MGSTVIQKKASRRRTKPRPDPPNTRLSASPQGPAGAPVLGDPEVVGSTPGSTPGGTPVGALVEPPKGRKGARVSADPRAAGSTVAGPPAGANVGALCEPSPDFRGPSSRRIEVWPIERLRPYERNPRMHSRQQVAEIAASIIEFGFVNPILVASDSGIVAGHGRLLAARQLGLKNVPVLVLDHLSPVQRRAYLLADNKLAERATWDKEMLAGELKALLDDDFSLAVMGFDDAELEAILGAGIHGFGGAVDEDSVPEPPDNPVTKPGDLWILGDHRLLCGDAGKAEDVDHLLAGAPVHLVNTDPPYNVRVEPRSNNAIAAGLSSFPMTASAELARRQARGIEAKPTAAAKRKPLAVKASDARGMHHQGFDLARYKTKSRPTGKMRPKDRPLTNDFISDEAFDAMLRAWFGNIARVLEPGRSFYIWGGYANIGNYPPALKECGLYFSQSIIWVKGWPVLTRKDYMGAHEWAFYGWREGAAHYFTPEIHNATDVWEVRKINPVEMEHLTAKPAELAVRAMTYSSRRGENVLDLFGGSGSTLIGAVQAGRRSFLMEIDPAYCDVICDRFQRFTGIPAILERTGASPIPMKPREENMR